MGYSPWGRKESDNCSKLVHKYILIDNAKVNFGPVYVGIMKRFIEDNSMTL